jgi:hypothetical protein
MCSQHKPVFEKEAKHQPSVLKQNRTALRKKSKSKVVDTRWQGRTHP